MKIGILGGTFNPIHISHVKLAEEYANKLGLDRMVLSPTSIPPHKSYKDLASGADRLAMCKLATAAYPLFHVTDFEIKEKGKSYTYRTLRHLAEKYPGAELFLIMGGDMFMTVQDWRLPQEIFKTATLCAAQREKGELTLLDIHKQILERQGARCILIDMEAQPMSSTGIRETIASGGDPSELLHPDVWSYIQERGLYKKLV